MVTNENSETKGFSAGGLLFSGPAGSPEEPGIAFFYYGVFKFIPFIA
jgi:hypothetical protein